MFAQAVFLFRGLASFSFPINWKAKLYAFYTSHVTIVLFVRHGLKSKFTPSPWTKHYLNMYTQIFKHFLPGVSVPSDFARRTSRIFWKFNNSWIFWKLFQEISVPLSPVSKVPHCKVPFWTNFNFNISCPRDA